MAKVDERAKTPATTAVGSRGMAGGIRVLVERSRLFLVELPCFLAIFGVYYLGRGFRADQPGPATANAERVIEFERVLGFWWEPAWHDLARGSGPLTDAANVTYSVLHLPAIFAIGLILFMVDVEKYRVLRNALLLSGLVAIPIYHLFPLTPPRLLAANGVEMGFVDTVGALRGSKVGWLTNNYAAMPSYHFGWILLVVVYGAYWYTRSWVVRGAAIAFAAWMWACIVFTANHYFLDMIAGAALVTVALVVTVRWERFIGARPARERRWFFVRDTGAGRFRLPF